MGQTIAEKILSRQNVTGTPVKAGDMLDAEVNGLLSMNWPLVRQVYRRMGFPDGPPVVWDTDKFYLMVEHNQPPANEQQARSNLLTRREAARLNLKHFYDSEMGICHQMMVDYGHVRPGELVIGDDSHTVAYGALNAASTGIGTDEEAYVVAFGQLFFTVPETIKIRLTGKVKPYPWGKDFMLYLAGQYGDAFAQNKAIEYHGQLTRDMDIATRMTIADHTVEVGGKFGFFMADEKTEAFVRARTDKPFQAVDPDSDAGYVREIEINVDDIGFQVAKPFRFDNVSPVQDVLGVKINQARLGSCANGRLEDIEVAARIMKGRKVAPGVIFYVSPASMTVYREASEAGLITTLLEAGVQVQQPGCGICQGQIVLNEETCITSTTRNYHGRFGGSTCADAQIYLAGPATVAAAAVAGEIIDPREVMDV